MNTRISTRHSRAGFSLAELMVVIVIIGLLATMVVPNVISRFFKSQRGVAKIELNTIKESLDNYVIEHGGKWPDSLEVLVTPDESGHTYLDREEMPTDPWKWEYQYAPPEGNSQKPTLFSFGKDGQSGGDGDDADIHFDDRD